MRKVIRQVHRVKSVGARANQSQKCPKTPLCPTTGSMTRHVTIQYLQGYAPATVLSAEILYHMSNLCIYGKKRYSIIPV